MEKDEREKEEARKAKEDTKKAEEDAKEAENARRWPKAHTFGLGLQKDSNLVLKQRETRRAIRSFVETLELVVTLKKGVSKIQEDGSIQSEGNNIGQRYLSELDFEYSQLGWNLMQIFHKTDQAIKGNLGWFLDQFNTVSRFVPVADFANTFELLIRTYTIKVDPDGMKLRWFFRVFGAKLLSEVGFKNLVDPGQAASWGLPRNLKAIGVERKVAKEIMTAMGDDLKVDGGGPSAEFVSMELDEAKNAPLPFKVPGLHVDMNLDVELPGGGSDSKVAALQKGTGSDSGTIRRR